MKQNLELELDKKTFDDMVEKLGERRRIREEKFDKKKAKQGPSVSEALKNAEKYKNMDEHRIELKELYQRLEVEEDQGLSDSVAHQRNKEFGDNVLSEKKRTPWYIKLLHEMTGFFSLLLWLGSILCFVAYGLSQEDPSNLYLGVVLFVVVILTGIMTFYQNSKSDAIMDAFKNFIPP